MICEVCERYEATTKDYRADGEKWRSCQWCANLSTRNWYYIMHQLEVMHQQNMYDMVRRHRSVGKTIDP